jgi:peptide/nickel transport system permease protein
MSTNSPVLQLAQDQLAEETYRSESLYTKGLRRLLRDRLTMTALIIIALLLIISFSSPLINQYILQIDPNKTDAMNTLQGYGTPGHLLGTDELGRDVLARLLVAGRVSLSIGFYGAIASLIIGMIVGLITGYFGGVVDDIVNWVITTLDSIPSLYLLIMIAALLRPTAEALILAIALISWTGVARIIRGQTLSIRNLDYVLSARAMGASAVRIMFAHILPNLISITVIVLARAVGNLMLAEAGLSFLGFGVQPPQATWGNMLSRSQEYIRTAPHLIWPPGVMITMAVLCLYVIGDGIRDAFDPTSRR